MKGGSLCRVREYVGYMQRQTLQREGESSDLSFSLDVRDEPIAQCKPNCEVHCELSRCTQISPLDTVRYCTISSGTKDTDKGAASRPGPHALMCTNINLNPTVDCSPRSRLCTFGQHRALAC